MRCNTSALLELYDLTQFLEMEGSYVKQLYPRLKLFLDDLDVFVKEPSKSLEMLRKLEDQEFACKRIKHIFGIDLFREGDFAMTKNEWIEDVLIQHPKADRQVIRFIADFTFHHNDGFRNDLTVLFTKGYCLHFANMLKTTFNKGEVCLAYPDYHMVWRSNGVSYDVLGVNTSYEKLIPIKYLEDYVLDFKHIPDVQADESEKTFIRHVEELLDAGKFIM